MGDDRGHACLRADDWVLVRLSKLDEVEMRELVLDAWAMEVTKRVAAAYADAR